MKHSLIGAILLLILSACGNTQRTAFYVEGNCDACKSIIENTLDDARGVDSAGWDAASSIATVKYNDGRTTVDEIQQLLASKGFETQFFPADAAARKQLPACCQQPITRRLKEIAPQLQLPSK